MKSILWLNFLNAIIWFVIFFSLKVLSPSVFSCLFLGSIPINLFIIELTNSKTNKKRNFTIALLLLTMFLLMLLLVYQDMSESNSFQILEYGALVTFIGGIVAAFIMKISKKLATNDLPASLVVSLRFYGLLIISLIIIVSNQSQLLIQPIVLVELFSLALVSMALPLFLLQSIKNFKPIICINNNNSYSNSNLFPSAYYRLLLFFCFKVRNNNLILYYSNNFDMLEKKKIKRDEINKNN